MSGSAEIYEAVFSFDSSWDGFARTAVFECAGERREQLLVGDRCIVPWEILHAGAYLRVGVYGVDGNKTMPTVYSGTMFVARGAEPSDAAREHSPDVFDQIVEIGGQVAQDAESAGESAEDAATSATAAQNAKDAAIEALKAFHAPTATAQTLQPGTPATASYSGGVLSLGIPKGDKGDKGDKGETGAQGATGPQGVQGQKGDTGATGPQGPKGDDGENGITPHINPSNKHWMLGNTDTGIVAEGQDGADGAKGDKGDKGDTGPQGETGPQGPKGDKGATGQQGPKGDTGATGPQGPAGATPQRGVDYWTAADQAQIVQDVLAALPVMEGGSY